MTTDPSAKPALAPGCICRYVWQKMSGRVGQWILIINPRCPVHGGDE